MYLTVDPLIDINNIIIGSNNLFLRKVNAKPCGYDKMYMDKDLIGDKLYIICCQFQLKVVKLAEVGSSFL